VFIYIYLSLFKRSSDSRSAHSSTIYQPIWGILINIWYKNIKMRYTFIHKHIKKYYVCKNTNTYIYVYIHKHTKCISTGKEGIWLATWISSASVKSNCSSYIYVYICICINIHIYISIPKNIHINIHVHILIYMYRYTFKADKHRLTSSLVFPGADCVTYFVTLVIYLDSITTEILMIEN
jgi:hypothetical protein